MKHRKRCQGSELAQSYFRRRLYIQYKNELKKTFYEINVCINATACWGFNYHSSATHLLKMKVALLFH